MNVKARIEVNPRLRELPQVAKLDMGDMKRLADAIDSRFVTNERALFASEGASGGERWAPLSPDYAEAKRRRFPGRKILARTGRLRRSLTQKGDPEHVAVYRLAPRPVVEVGTEVEVGAYHAPGPLHNPNLPVRDPLQHTPQQERDYFEVVRDYLVNVKLARVVRVLAAWSRIRGGGRA